MAKRKSTGKRLRFEVFKRDHFTCQYCGAQPPAVVLVVDHVTPVCEGGESSIDNLITACETCNQGKAGKSLSHVPIRPDADLLYLETEQEIAELQRYRTALARKEQEVQLTVETLQELWAKWTGLDWVPGDYVIRQMMQRFPLEVVENAMQDVALKIKGGYLKSYNGKWVAYMHRVAQNMMGDEE
jgi:hypothetical protein